MYVLMLSRALTEVEDLYVSEVVEGPTISPKQSKLKIVSFIWRCKCFRDVESSRKQRAGEVRGKEREARKQGLPLSSGKPGFENSGENALVNRDDVLGEQKRQ